MEKKVLFNERQIAYKISGNGPVIVLLHGFMETKSIWEDFTGKLTDSFKIVAIDLPGHGASESVADVHTMKLMSDVVKEVFTAEDIVDAIIVGHSMGGYVALQFASEHENLLKGLVLFHSHANADTDEAKENRRRTINIVKQNKTGFILQFIPELFDQKHIGKHTGAIQKLQEIAGSMSPESIIAALAGMRDRESQLQYLLISELPVLFIIGKQDSRMPYNQVLAQAVIPSHSEVLLLEDVGHMGYIEAFEKTLDVVKHFSIRCFH